MLLCCRRGGSSLSRRSYRAVGDLNLCKNVAVLQPGGAASARVPRFMLVHVGGCAEDPWELVSCVQGAAKAWQIGEAEDTAAAPQSHSGV